MNFATRLVLSAIFLALFAFGFAYYQLKYPWSPSTLEMYPCLLVMGLVWLFLAKAPNRHRWREMSDSKARMSPQTAKTQEMRRDSNRFF